MADGKNKRLVEEAKEQIRNFWMREYGECWEDDLVNISRIPLARVLSEDELTDTEIAVDLVRCCVNTYLGKAFTNGVQLPVRQINFRNIKELVNAIPKLDFQKLADLSQPEIDELRHRIRDAYERSTRSDSKCRMQVKCLEEDWGK